MFGLSTYRWTISYTGDISWIGTDNSIVGSVYGPGTGTDVVLIGLNSHIVPEPTSLLMLLVGMLLVWRRSVR